MVKDYLTTRTKRRERAMIDAERVTNPASGAAKARERPILFSSEMVKAILDGRKTMTRRVVKDTCPFVTGAYFDEETERWYWTTRAERDRLPTDLCLGKCPYGQPGERLWVRESFWAVEVEDQGIGNQFLVYDEEFVGSNPKPKELRPTLHLLAQPLRWGHHPSIHMPRWASRITLEITAVRVERVQDISEEDAVSEGVAFCNHGVEHDGRHYRCGFRALWDSINAKRGYGWENNPFVWAISFRRLP